MRDKITGFLKNRRRIVLCAGILCIIILSGVLLIGSIINTEAAGKPGEYSTGSKGDDQYASAKLIVYPEKYTMAMSSTPGIRISVRYSGTADKVRYTSSYGGFLTWDKSTGKISKLEQAAELPLSIPVYWSPQANTSLNASGRISVKAEIFNKGGKLEEKQVNISFDNASYLFTVETTPEVIISETAQKPGSIDEAVSLAIKGQGKGYGAGEVSTEGHIILDSEEKDGKVKVYTIASFGAFGFENGIFTKVSGSGAISTVITFSRNENGGYSLLEVREPMDGSGNLKSKKAMFPKRLWSKALSEQKYYPDLAKQQEAQAKLYLQSIGRNAKVSEAYVDRKLPDINVEASNKLFAEFTKYDSELNSFPYWLGTREFLTDGVRYVYETSQSKTDDGYDLISFKKMLEDGTIAKEYRYKIVGSEPQLLK